MNKSVATSTSGNSRPDASPSWLKYVAMLTGVLAALGAFLTVRGAAFSNDAIYHSSVAVLHQAKASDTWSEYQADSIKRRIVQTQAIATTDPAARQTLEEQAKEIADRQPALKSAAEQLESQREQEVAKSNHSLGEKVSLDYAGMFVQLGIALASVAAMTKRKFAFVAGIIAAGVGAGVTVFVMARHYLA